MKKLVIVESECKAKRFKEFLDADYEVVTCYGAVRDLPEKEIGVKVTETDVEVQFVTPEKSERTLEFLRNKVLVILTMRANSWRSICTKIWRRAEKTASGSNGSVVMN